MATTTPNFGWSVPTSTDLVKDGATAIETLGDAIDASLVDLKGGTTGQVLAKNSNTDMDFVWASDATGIPATIFDAKGDLIAASAADTAARLAVGTNGQILTADSTAATGLAWTTPAGGGKVLQVVGATTSTEKSIASTSFTDTNLTVTITPSSSSSKVLILASQSLYINSSATEFVNVGLRLRRSTTTVIDYSGLYDQAYAIYTETVSGSTYPTIASYIPITVLDSPATTSAITYTVQVKMSSTQDRNAICQQATSSSSIVALEIGA